MAIIAAIDADAFEHGSAVTAVTNPPGEGITKIWTGTQAQYDAIAVKDPDTLYLIVSA